MELSLTEGHLQNMSQIKQEEYSTDQKREHVLAPQAL